MVELEAAVVKILEEKRTINTKKEKPQQPEIVELINNLILDYIDHMGYSLTKNIFLKGLWQSFCTYAAMPNDILIPSTSYL